MRAPIRIVIIDDSAVQRRWVRETLVQAGMEVVAEAANGRLGRDMIVTHQPDVVVLDIVMPEVDGITLLRAITRHAPRPVVVMSSLIEPGSQAMMEALEAGATHVIAKPRSREHAVEVGGELVMRVKQAAASAVRYSTQKLEVQTLVGARFAPRQLIAIGASTGGPRAIKSILAQLPPSAPPVVISQHVGQGGSLAERLASATGRDIVDARDRELLVPGMLRIAPPGSHLVVEWTAPGYVTRLDRGPAEHFQRPAVDVMFRSVAIAARNLAVGVLLTGMGTDGAEGLARMREAGATTIAQDEATSVVFGMPRAAIELQAASAVVGLEQMAATIVRSLRRVQAA